MKEKCAFEISVVLGILNQVAPSENTRLSCCLVA